MAQSVINLSPKHAVAGSTRLAATNASGGLGIFDIKISKDLDNGTIIGKGDLIAGEVYAMAAPTTFTGKRSLSVHIRSNRARRSLKK